MNWASAAAVGAVANQFGLGGTAGAVLDAAIGIESWRRDFVKPNPMNQAMRFERVGAKRRNTGPVDDNQGFFTGQYRQFRSRYGRKKSSRSALIKLDRRDACYNIERFGRVTRLTDTTLSFPLNLTRQLLNDVPQLTYYPFYALDLTQRMYNAADAPNAIPCFCRMFSNDVTNAIGFTNYQGVPNSGAGATVDTKNVPTFTNGNTYFQQLKTNAERNNRGGAAQVLAYSDVKLLFRAPTSRAGYVKVMLCQVAEQITAPTSAQPSSVARDAAFERLIKPLLYSPITQLVSGTSSLQPFKVLQTWTRNFSPDSKENQDANGQTIRLDLFLNHNRYCQFRRRYGDDTDNTVQLDGRWIEGQEDEVAGDYYNHIPDARARLFLFIMGTNYDSAITFTGETQPQPNASTNITFDMEVKHKWLYRNQTGL